jgi:uncharacterized protein YdgA (DUF945 family)
LSRSITVSKKVLEAPQAAGMSITAQLGTDELDGSSLQVLHRQVQQQMHLLHQQQIAVAREAQVGDVLRETA